jgi:hypothetical protein
MGWDLDVLRGLEAIQLVEQLQHGALHFRVTTFRDSSCGYGKPV